MISEYRNFVFSSFHEALKNYLLRSTDLYYITSSYRTESSSGSGFFYTAYNVAYPGYSILAGKSILDNLIGKSGTSCDSLLNTFN